MRTKKRKKKKKKKKPKKRIEEKIEDRGNTSQSDGAMNKARKFFQAIYHLA